MSELTPQALVALPPPNQAELDLDDIQGDVLLGLQKDHELFVFFEITDVARFKQVLRRKLVRHVTSTRDVRRREFELRDNKANHGPRLNLVGLNLGFSASGIQKLKPGANPGDPSFIAGAAARAAAPNPITASTRVAKAKDSKAASGGPKNAGVWKRANGRHVAVVYRGEATIFAGTWATWEEAAIARDRAVLHLGFTDQPLNFPARSKRKGAASPDDLTRESHFARPARKTAEQRARQVPWRFT